MSGSLFRKNTTLPSCTMGRDMGNTSRIVLRRAFSDQLVLRYSSRFTRAMRRGAMYFSPAASAWSWNSDSSVKRPSSRCWSTDSSALRMLLPRLLSSISCFASADSTAENTRPSSRSSREPTSTNMR